jgi:hypothetical protein
VVGPTKTEGNPKPGGPFVATVISTVLWVLSIILAFVIKPGQALAFVPDALLLLGFFPLLILWRRGWVILLFGFFNAFIGFFLLLLEFLPDEKFTGAMQAMRQHLLSMHSCWTWMIVGVVALVWGALSIVVRVTKWFLKKRKTN